MKLQRTTRTQRGATANCCGAILPAAHPRWTVDEATHLDCFTPWAAKMSFDGLVFHPSRRRWSHRT